jgi:hypothetical protein
MVAGKIKSGPTPCISIQKSCIATAVFIQPENQLFRLKFLLGNFVMSCLQDYSYLDSAQEKLSQRGL